MSQGKRDADDAILMALACGATQEAAARTAGVSKSTVERRMQDLAFRSRLHAIRQEIVERTTGMLTAAASEAVKTLVDLLKEPIAPASRLGAARTILEMGVKLRELADLGERVRSMEEQMATMQGTNPPPSTEAVLK
ncbi:hypothetical protein [Tuwongella immobilis]|uniref:Uncharacterized protein n=1 Tax=Tuwongella immobilis TaxID=692036 RepID=A0A6C2YR07_9BACT|nr:hypothetical protein [Tuwongella immobilis]VIP03771.1 Uncultured bacterium genome assembly Metasoil_fosmids_resub OS=uncultured bacterium PE=4 SV=1 [Tuwongella immobilis]VTS04910.1 Uncultured bacterium genome assembly Metasoil_fosmids_resub OS=uncultured bacterium PE=4 SV=1 [Tuwongella immobilis]